MHCYESASVMPTKTQILVVIHKFITDKSVNTTTTTTDTTTDTVQWQHQQWVRCLGNNCHDAGHATTATTAAAATRNSDKWTRHGATAAAAAATAAYPTECA